MLISTLRPGAAYIPEDFPSRLDRLRRWTVLSWTGFAEMIGVDPRQMRRWRRGAKPSGEAMLSLFRLAHRNPGAVYLLVRP